MTLRWHRTLLAGLVMALSPVVALSAPPGPPCSAHTNPEYPSVGAAPTVKLWTKSDLDSGWKPPDCTAWPRGETNVVVGLAGRFKLAGGADSLLTRIGAISSLVQVRYWSVRDKQWNNMFTRAVALSGPDPKTRRPDFSAVELRSSGNRYFAAADIRSGKDAVSSLHVSVADSAHFAVETQNVTPLRWTFLTYADPGSFQTWYFFERETGATWRYYSLTRVLYASSLFGSVIPNNSYINREVAMYRYFVGQPTERDPPAAP